MPTRFLLVYVGIAAAWNCSCPVHQTKQMYVVLTPSSSTGISAAGGIVVRSLGTHLSTGAFTSMVAVELVWV
ncbi:hypothetical protein VTO73DRAFT_6043 [Trametes versicolor]